MTMQSMIAVSGSLRSERSILNGRVAGTGLVETARGRFQWPEVKMVLAEYYNGEEYKDLGRSGDELAQGWFMDELFLHHCLRNGPFESYAEYKKAFKKYANW